jgi:hypothetical protein
VFTVRYELRMKKQLSTEYITQQNTSRWHHPDRGNYSFGGVIITKLAYEKSVESLGDTNAI